MPLAVMYVCDTYLICRSAPADERGEPAPDPVREQVCGWLRRHGIDPRVVDQDKPLGRLPTARQVRVWRYVDEAGEPARSITDIAITPDEDGVSHAVSVEHRIQLEAAPSPWPDVVWDRTRWLGRHAC